MRSVYTEIPEPALKQHKPQQTEGMKNIRNRLTSLETRRAKCKRSLQVLREHARNSTCPYGLQYRPKPHIRFDREFQTSMDQICQRAHAELLTLMIKEQEKNLAADNQAIQAQQQRLQNLCPNQPSSQAARNRAKPRMRPKEERSGFPRAFAKKYQIEGVKYRCEGEHAVRNQLYFKWLFFLIQEQRR